MSLSADLIQRIIAVCAPYMETEDARRNRFTLAFGTSISDSDVPFRKHIEWKGNTQDFLLHLIRLLDQIHRHNGVHPLRTLLESLRRDCGEDRQREIDALLPLIDALPSLGAPTIFLSYARADDEPFVRRLYDDLTAQGFRVWFDRENMPNRGLSFSDEIALAIEQAERLLLICGPDAYQSEYVRKEWQHALLHCKPIIPIVRLGDFPPPILSEIGVKPVDAIDMREDAHYSVRLDYLTRQLRDAPLPLAPLTNVRAPKTWYLPRADVKQRVIETLGALGRENALAISAINGLGGVGKSVLAALVARDCEVRRRFRDGIAMIEVGKQPNLIELQARLGALVGLEAKEFTGDLDANRQRLSQAFCDKHMLIILDNVWKREAINALSCGASGLKFILTTRVIALANNYSAVRVDLLSDREGGELILKRAKLPEAQRADCEAIARQLNGLTLAISIAAAKIENDGSTAAAYLERLKHAENPLSHLTLADPDDPSADTNSNEENFEVSLALTYGELNGEMQRRFRALGVFAPDGTFDAAAAAAVWAEPTETAQSKLNVLVNLALAERDAAGRYSQHSLLRAYARALLREAGELESAAARHFSHYYALHGDHDTNNDETRHPHITLDFENIRAALTWAAENEPSQAADWASALDFYLQLHQPYSLWRTVLEQGLAAAERAGYAGGQAHTLRALGELESREDNYAAARSCYREALGLYQAIPERLGQANTLLSLGDLERREANLTAARSCYREALGLYQAIPSRLGQANTLRSLGDLERREANLTAARSCYREALGLYQAIPDRLGQAHTLRSLGDLESMEANLTAARSCYREALGLYQAIPDRLGQANTLLMLGELERREANYAAARRCYREALSLYQAIPDRLGQANTLQSLGDLERMEANLTAARSCYREALGLYQAIPDRLGQANTHWGLGELERMETNFAAAREHYLEALGLYQAISDRLGQAITHWGLGELERMETNFTAARERYLEALQVFEAISDRLRKAYTLRGLGDLERMEANYPQARSNYLQALELARSIPDLLCQLESLHGLAQLELAIDNRDAACQRYAELLALAESAPAFANHPRTREWRREAAQVCGGA